MVVKIPDFGDFRHDSSAIYSHCLHFPGGRGPIVPVSGARRRPDAYPGGNAMLILGLIVAICLAIGSVGFFIWWDKRAG